MKQSDSSSINITHYSDILCVWAFVSQVRMRELQKKFNQYVKIDYRFINVFGDVNSMFEKLWATRGGAAGYSDHVCAVAQQFTHVSINPDVWKHEAPTSSLPAHLVLCAVRDLIARKATAEETLEKVASAIRHAFFVDCRNVARRSVLYEVLEQCGVDLRLIDDSIENGLAYAIMARDMQSVNALHIETSPTLLFNEDRQRLAGNVGYRIIEANVQELLSQRGQGQYSAWC